MATNLRWSWGPAMGLQVVHQQREFMFEKPLTPSDVGKLNRLVIPKQYAERYFPLDGSSGEKGFLLSFEDESGKQWRFRYSYWTSSQSYVLTKGWSRYVKEKRLDAGDIVLFERIRPAGGGGGGERLCIGWRRRGSTTDGAPVSARAETAAYAAEAWSQLYNNGMGSAQQESLYHGGVERQAVPATSKRLRLFGVNLDCEPESPESPEPARPVFGLLNQASPCNPIPSPHDYWRTS